MKLARRDNSPNASQRVRSHGCHDGTDNGKGKIMSLHYVKSESGRIVQTNNISSWTNGFLKGEPLPKKEGARLYQDQAKDSLRDILRQGDTVHCILRHVSASGMSRAIDFYVIKDNRPIWLSGYIAAALDYKPSGHTGIAVKGCGMDMGFAVVYNLARTLWPEGNASRTDKDSGYLLKSEWI